MLQIKRIAQLIILLVALPVNADEAVPHYWAWVDVHGKRIVVLNDRTIVKVFTGASIGMGGAGQKTGRGDRITPIGLYKIGWTNERSQFHRFFGLNYPSVADANYAIIHKHISLNQYRAIIAAHDEGRVPPQNTPLGGNVGIHGLRRKDQKVHETMNWTFGCIALTNKQIDSLSNYLKKDTPVMIK